MPFIATTISKCVRRNAIVKEVILVPDEVLLGRVILDSPLLACLPVLDVFVKIAFSVKVRIRSVVSRKVKVK